MKILLSWLRDFVDVPVGAEALADVLAMRGFELAGIERPGGATDESDAVLDLEITANRPDCLSVIGIAREVATIYELPLRLPGPANPTLGTRTLPAADTDGMVVRLDEPDLCPRYAAALADVRIGPSPAWLAGRLQAAGVRPINNLVDLTNYVLLELGHPMHGFDLHRLHGGELRIRRARGGEKLTTLDGQARTLADDMLVIADAANAQAVAGVMGGADSEVSAGTRTVALESAYFKPTSVRRTSRRLGLKTEASARFERGADVNAPVLALERLAWLLQRIGAGEAHGTVIDRYPVVREPTTLMLRRSRVAQLLGQDVEPARVARILSGLGFDAIDETRSAGGAGEVWRVRVPTARVDVAREIDLIEEIARHVGYDRLPTTFPPLGQLQPGHDPRIERDRRLRRVLAAAGCSEAITFTFIEQAAAQAFASGGTLVPIANPLSEKFAVLRPSLLPGLVDSAARNRRRGQYDVRLFEIGSRYSRERGEGRAVGLVAVGAGSPEHWSGTGRAADFFDVKAAVERLCDAFGISPRFEPVRRDFLVAGRTAAVLAAKAPDGEEEIGVIGELLPATAAARDLAADAVYVAEIDLDRLDRVAAPRDDVRVEPLPRYPSIVRDIALLVDEALPAAAVRGTIRAAAPETLVSIHEFDRYRGKGVPEGAVSLAVRLTFRSPSRTLTDAEVQSAVRAIVGALQEKHGATLRGEIG